MVRAKFLSNERILNLTFIKIFHTAGPKQVGKPVVMPEQMSDTTGTISWPASTDDVDTYQVTLTDSTGNSRTIIVPGNQTSTTVDDFIPDTNYTVSIVAVKNGAQSKPSELTPFMTKSKGYYHKDLSPNLTIASQTQ